MPILTCNRLFNVYYLSSSDFHYILRTIQYTCRQTDRQPMQFAYAIYEARDMGILFAKSISDLCFFAFRCHVQTTGMHCTRRLTPEKVAYILCDTKHWSAYNKPLILLCCTCTSIANQKKKTKKKENSTEFHGMSLSMMLLWLSTLSRACQQINNSPRNIRNKSRKSIFLPKCLAVLEHETYCKIAFITEYLKCSETMPKILLPKIWCALNEP